MPTFVLLSTAVLLTAVDAPLPLEMSALVMVGIILRWFVIRENKSASRHDERLVELEEEMAHLREEASAERHRKHVYLNQLTGIQAAFALVLSTAHTCTCNAMDAVIPVLEKLSTPRDTPTPTEENP